MDYEEKFSNSYEPWVKTEFVKNQLNKQLYKHTLSAPMREI